MSNLLSQASLVMIPSGYKEDVVYSQIPTDGSGDLSFTRASNGTRINSAGLVEVCPWNLLNDSEDFASSFYTKEATTISSNSTTAPNGTTTADTSIPTNANTIHRIQAPFDRTSGQQYTFCVYAKASGYNFLYMNAGTMFNARSTFNLSNGSIDTAIGTASIESVGNGWYRCSVSGTASASGATVAFLQTNSTTSGPSDETFAGNGTSGIFIWGAQINIGSTAKPYFPTTDRLNVPRLTYQNGGGGCPSLLLEKQSTNLALYSQDISNTSGGYWGDGSSGGTATVTANYATSPDGTQNATRIQLNEGSLYAVWQQVIATTSGTTYTYSIWLKAVSGTPTIVWIYDGTANRNITLTNEWVRYTWTFTGGTIQISRFGVWSGVWGTSSTADILAWGAQVEASSYATSYIPTTSSSATRVADACYKTGISSLIGQTSGSVFFDFTVASVTQPGDPVLWYMKDGGAGERYVELYSNGNLVYAEIDGSGPIATITKNGLTIGRHKCAIAYATNDFVFYVDGVQIGTDTSGTPNGFSTFGLQYYLSVYTGQQQVNQCAIFKTRLTNAELASLTTI